jgi:hypothetical protein
MPQVKLKQLTGDQGSQPAMASEPFTFAAQGEVHHFTKILFPDSAEGRTPLVWSLTIAAWNRSLLQGKPFSRA